VLDFRAIARTAVRKVSPIHKIPENDREGRYKIQGSWMYVDDKDSLDLTRKGVYEYEETQLIKKILKSDSIVLDIGANIGYFTLIMAKRAKLVYAFEPEPRNFHILQKNTEINNIKNAKLYNAAVTEASGTSTLYLCDSNRGMHRIYQSDWCREGTTEVKTIRIDDIIDHADFIKIDVEGAELGVLKGMRKILEKRKSIALMEFHPPSIIEYGAKPRDVFDFMTSLGYTVRTPNGKPISFEGLEKMAIDKVATNIMCTP
jgi:FkbM family methyltransferase